MDITLAYKMELTFWLLLPPPTNKFFDLTRLKEQISGSFIEDILDLNIIKHQ